MTIELAGVQRQVRHERGPATRQRAQVVEVGASQYVFLRVRGIHYLVQEGPSSLTYELRPSGRAPGELLAVRLDAPHDSLKQAFYVEDDEEGGEEGGEVVVVRS